QAVFYELVVIIHCRCKERLTRNKHDHKLWGFAELLPVAFTRQGQHVRADLGGVTRKRNPSRLFGFGGESVQVSIERYLSINHDFSFGRKVNYKIWTNPPMIGGNGELLCKVTVLGHSSEFNDPLERHLAPSATDLRRSQGRDQTSCLFLELLVSFRQVLEMHFKARVSLLAGLLKTTDVVIKFPQGLVERVD